MSENTSDIQYGSDLGSEFESDSEIKQKKAKKKDLYKDGPSRSIEGVAKRREVEEEYNKEERRIQRPNYISMDAYARHKKLVNDYILFYGGKSDDFKRDSSRDRTDQDVLREHHKFLWEDDEDLSSWEKKLAKKYYDKLFKEYCITDLSRYKENKVAMRWRIEKEVVDGKGQFTCGSKECKEMEALRSWEVNFAYVEDGDKKNALVKLRLCPECSYKLNYHKKRREVLPRKRKKSDNSTDEPKIKSTKDGEKSDTKDTKDDTKDESVPTEEPDDDAATTKSIWEGPVKVEEDKSRDDEFDEYLADLML